MADETIRSSTYRLLQEWGIHTIFGNPGSNELPMIKALPEGMEYVLGLHEGAVLAMADGYALASGKPAMVSLHSAAGLGNAMGNLTNAQAAHTPLLITAGQQVRSMIPLNPMLTDVDAIELPKPLVKWSGEPSRPQEVPLLLSRALRIADLPPRGPAFVSLPVDDWEHRADPELEAALAVRTVSGRTRPDPGALAVVADALVRARNPVLVLGPDVDACGGFYDAVRLSEALALPVHIAPTAPRCPFPTTHPHFRGVLPASIGGLSRTLEGHDLVLAVGTAVFRYHENSPGPYLPEGTRLYAVTSDQDEAARAPMGHAVIGDPAFALAELLDLVPESAMNRPALAPLPAPDLPQEDGAPLSAAAVARAVSDTKPEDAIVVAEWTSGIEAIWRHVSLTRPGSYFFPASGCLGWGLPAAIGVQLAQPRRPVVALIGDGASHYTISALWTAAHYGVPVTFLLMRNNEYGALKRFSELLDTPEAPGLELPGIDHCAIARGYGLPAVRPDSLAELRAELAKAFAAPGPHFIEVPVRRWSEGG
ncbi:benzoylformate decarboxylase [Streptomyces sp. NPDC050504]|uniref:benzoylformate decarboxylase n=1 Tax=Streptomyces sp. NPDC050504 TaxID=3365618 RepID=UPI0037B99123